MGHKIRGDLEICRTQTSKRTDEQLVTEALAAGRQIVRHESHWGSFDGGALERQVEMPDATTLPEGWQMVIHNTGSTDDLNVREYNATSYTGDELDQVEPGQACEFTLIDNASSDGVWYVNCLESPEQLVANKFCTTFLTTDFTAPSGGYSEITENEVAGLGAATHGRGRNPIWILQERSTAPVAASLIEQDLTYTAVAPGTPGNAITIEYQTGGTAGSEVVTVIENAILVTLDSGVSTATEVKAAIDAEAEATALVSVTISGTAGDPQSITGPTNLASGADGDWDRVTGDRERVNGGDLNVRVAEGCEFDGRVCFV